MDNGIKVISLVGNSQSPSRIWQTGLSRFFVLSLMKIISISILKQKFYDIYFVLSSIYITFATHCRLITPVTVGKQWVFT